MNLCLQKIMFDLFIFANTILEIFISFPYKSNHILNSVSSMKKGQCDRSFRIHIYMKLVYGARLDMGKFSL